MILIEGDALGLAVDQPGTRTLKLRLLPILREQTWTLELPPCPSATFETSGLPADRSVVLESGGREQALSAGQSVPLPHSGGSVTLRLLDSRETREALRPPEPSTWTWQHQALILPEEGELLYKILVRASTTGGSGVEALLTLPPDASDIEVSGDDLVSHAMVRGDRRSPALALVWKTRGILDRKLAVSYRMPLRPLDRTWHLQAPGGDDTRTRFIVADRPLLSYTADDLTGPFTPEGIPADLAGYLGGGNCHFLEAGTDADLTVTTVPVAATAGGVVAKAEWSLKIEPDGAMLATGMMAIAHKRQLDFEFDTPEGMKLLACEVGGKPVSPVDLGEGRLMVTLPPQGEQSCLACSFTGRAAKLDPVEGTVKLALPRTPLFIHSLLWTLDLPARLSGGNPWQPDPGANRRVQTAIDHRPAKKPLPRRTAGNPGLLSTLGPQPLKTRHPIPSMKLNHLLASLAIIAATAVAWFLLGGALSQRTKVSSAAMQGRGFRSLGTRDHPATSAGLVRNPQRAGRPGAGPALVIAGGREPLLQTETTRPALAPHL